jgi:hypothetical protein
MKVFYRYEYVFWRLKQFFLFRILPISSLVIPLYVENYACREGRYNTQAKQLRKQSKVHELEAYFHYTSWKCTLEFQRSPFFVSRRICMFLKSLSALSKRRHVQSTNSNRPSYLHPNVPDSVVLIFQILVEPFTFPLRLLNSEGDLIMM